MDKHFIGFNDYGEPIIGFTGTDEEAQDFFNSDRCREVAYFVED